MSVTSLLAELKARGVEVRLEDGRPRLIGPKSVLTEDLIATLRERREEIITALTSQKDQSFQRKDDAVPTRPCFACGGNRFWLRPTGGGWLCATCHPAPDDTLPEVIVLRDIKQALQRAVLELAEAAGWPRLALDECRTIVGAPGAWVAFSRTADVPTLRLAIKGLCEMLEADN